MKKVVLLLLAIPLAAAGQDTKKSLMFSVHEDQVRPSMVVEYERTCKELVALMKEHNIPGTQWLTSATNDFRYWYVSPVSSMADLDKNRFELITEKAGREKMEAIWSRMDKCYDRHGTYLVTLNEELSYQPGGIDQSPEGQPFRAFHFWHFTPEREAAAVEVARKMKAMSMAKKSPLHYRVYRSGFGTLGPYYLVAFAAGDASAFHKALDQAGELLGAEYLKLVNELRALALRYEEAEGLIRHDLSYKPAQSNAK